MKRFPAIWHLRLKSRRYEDRKINLNYQRQPPLKGKPRGIITGDKATYLSRVGNEQFTANNSFITSASTRDNMLSSWNMLSEEKTPSGEKSPIEPTLLNADKVIAVSLGTILM